MAASVQLIPSSDPQKRLLEIATQALRANPRNSDAATDQLAKAVRDSAELLWALFQPYRRTALRELLSAAGSEMWQPQKREENSGQARNAEVRPSIPAGSPVPRRPAPSPDFHVVAEMARLSLLDTFHIDRRPIGDVTPMEANTWAGNRERDVRFVRLLTQNLPPHEPIRKYRTAEMAEAIFKEAATKKSGPG